jgi:hypothetical protein
MSGAQQLDLIPRDPPKNVMEAIERKLPRADWVSVSDVAISINVSVTTVYSWLDEGLIQHVNASANKDRQYYRIYRPSVIAFFKARLGIEP